MGARTKEGETLSQEEIRARAEPTVRECARYQSGVTQLESDLRHYKEVSAQQKKSSKAGKGGKAAEKASLPPTPRPPPPPPLQPLSFDALGTTGNRFGGAGPGGGMMSAPR